MILIEKKQWLIPNFSDRVENTNPKARGGTNLLFNRFPPLKPHIHENNGPRSVHFTTSVRGE